MKYFIFLVLFKAIVCQGASLDDFIWLEGSWKAESSKSTIVETWNNVGDLTFEGTSVTTRKSDSQVSDSESLRLVLMSGDVFYIAKVSHNEYPVPFKLISAGHNIFVFENKKHDFPTRIEYRMISSMEMEVTVSGEKKTFVLKFRKQVERNER